MSKKFLNQILYNYKIKELANTILSSRKIITNPLYQHFYKKIITQTIKKYSKKPYSIRIENTNLCNGKCYMCPHPIMKREKGIMEKDLYTKIIDDAVKNKIEYINLHNFGEPLLDTEFVWRIKYAKQKGIKKISTNTNGLLLTSKLSQQLIDSNLDELYISVDAATKKTYDKIRIGLNYEIVEKNINNLIAIKKKSGSNIKIILDFLKFNLNQDETEIFISKWKNKVDYVCISQIHDWSSKAKTVKSEIQNYVSYSQAPCRLPFTEMLINWDGTVSICCQDIDGEVTLGDIRKKSIKEIWNNKKYKDIRKKHKNLDTNNLKLCKNCKLRTFWWTF